LYGFGYGPSELVNTKGRHGQREGMSLTLPDDAAEWATAWRERINDREGFAAAAADFSAVFCFEIQPDEVYDGDPIRFRVVVEDGACAAAETAADPEFDFALRGGYGPWKDLLRDELDVSAAVMGGTFDLVGNTMTLLQRKDAVSEMVAAARAVDTEFAH